MIGKTITIRQPGRRGGHAFPDGFTSDVSRWYTVPYDTYLSLIRAGRSVEVKPEKPPNKAAKEIAERSDPPVIEKRLNP